MRRMMLVVAVLMAGCGGTEDECDLSPGHALLPAEGCCQGAVCFTAPPFDEVCTRYVRSDCDAETRPPDFVGQGEWTVCPAYPGASGPGAMTRPCELSWLVPDST